MLRETSVLLWLEVQRRDNQSSLRQATLLYKLPFGTSSPLELCEARRVVSETTASSHNLNGVEKETVNDSALMELLGAKHPADASATPRLHVTQ